MNHRGLHLNREGSAQLQKNMANILKAKNTSSCEDIAGRESVNSYSNVFRHGLAIACLNINSLLAHIDDLKIFMVNCKIDILCINETKLDSSVSNSEIYLSGYDVVRLDRNVNGRNGGGVCIYIRSNLNFRIRKDLANKDLEFLLVEISKPRSKPFLVDTWYRPPSSPQESKLLCLKKLSIR